MRNSILVCLALITLLFAERLSAGQNKIPRVPRLDTVAAIDRAIDLNNPEIVVHYYYVNGDQPCKLKLPDDDEIVAFLGISVEADGKHLDPVDPTLGIYNVVFSRAVELKPGDSASVAIPISKIYKLPTTWKKLVVTPVPISAVRGIVVGLVISNGSATDTKE